MRSSLFGVVLASILVAACEKDGGSSTLASNPVTGSSPTVSSIVVSLPAVLLTGKSVTATATAMLSNGETRVVANGFRSDAPAIATASDVGVITGMSHGSTNISTTLDGVTGGQNLRVAPNYGGGWRGQQVMTSCSATGDFRGICEDPEYNLIGQSLSIALDARHVEDLLASGEFTIEIPFPTFTAPIEIDGSLRFSSTATSNGIRNHASWHINSMADGRAAGTIREVISAPDFAVGEVTYDSRLANFVRDVSSTLSMSNPPRFRSLRNKLAQMRSR